MIFHEYFRSWGGEKFPIWLIYYWQTTHIFTQHSSLSIADSATDQFHCKIQSSLHNSFQDPVWIWISEHHRSKVETRKVWAIIRFNKTVRIDFNIEQGAPNLSQNKLNICTLRVSKSEQNDGTENRQVTEEISSSQSLEAIFAPGCPAQEHWRRQKMMWKWHVNVVTAAAFMTPGGGIVIPGTGDWPIHRHQQTSSQQCAQHWKIGHLAMFIRGAQFQSVYCRELIM